MPKCLEGTLNPADVTKRWGSYQRAMINGVEVYPDTIGEAPEIGPP